jgi:release factor glutamine methyltransferase
VVNNPNSHGILADLVKDIIAEFKTTGIDAPEIDARLLVCHALGIDRAQMLSQSERRLTVDEITQIRSLITRRLYREPVARIIGHREFWSLSFELNEATLEPRPDSEVLIEVALDSIHNRKANLKVLDLGTGSGCLLLSLLHELPHAKGCGTDISPRALEMALHNAERLGLDKRALFHVTNWTEGINDSYDIIVCNPPYIDEIEIADLMPEVRDYDPRQALDGGKDGLSAYRIIIPPLFNLLKPTGFALLEIGIGQGEFVYDLCRANQFTDINFYKDLGGIERCVRISHI